jgi:hypothetical protein
MRKRILPIALTIASLLFSLPAFSQTTTPAPDVSIPAAPSIADVDLQGPTTVKSGRAFMVVVTKPKMPAGKEKLLNLEWFNSFPDGAVPAELTTNDGKSVMLFLDPPDGVYKFRIAAQVSVDIASGFDPRDESTLETTVGESGPATPGEPDAPAEPDSPPPSDEAAKVKTPGFRALFTVEKDYGLPDVLADPKVYAYLNAKTVKGEDGQTPDWRIVDNDESVAKDFKVFSEYRSTLPPGKGPPTSNEEPYVSFGDGKRGKVVNLSGMSSEALLTLLKTIGGN